jgi:hypothetical protein
MWAISDRYGFVLFAFFKFCSPGHPVLISPLNVGSNNHRTKDIWRLTSNQVLSALQF